MTKPKRTPDGVFYHPHYDRLMEHRGYSVRIFWSPAMLDYLRRHYPATLNGDLAQEIGVSTSTLVRKARELGLRKDPAWLASIWDERRRMAQAAAKRSPNARRFRKGEHPNPAGEFKAGEKRPPEWRVLQSAKMKQWHADHPDLSRRARLKAAQTRRQRCAAARENQNPN